jgi:hypothetical protein
MRTEVLLILCPCDDAKVLTPIIQPVTIDVISNKQIARSQSNDESRYLNRPGFLWTFRHSLSGDEVSISADAQRREFLNPPSILIADQSRDVLAIPGMHLNLSHRSPHKQPKEP